MDMMPYLEAVCGFSSTFSFTMRTFSPISPETSSRMGATMRQGPHHSAQKSTITGAADLMTSSSKL